MNESEFRLPRAPIIEAVLDIDCDMPPGQSLGALEAAARDRMRARYPKFRVQFVQEHSVETKPHELPSMSLRQHVGALQFLLEDERQLVQLRKEGFSFNRLAPYAGLDVYLPEIESAWHGFVEITTPLQITAVRVRYINRILLPSDGGRVDLNAFIRVAPKLLDEGRLASVGFLVQHAAVERETGLLVNMVVASQPMEDDRLPIILDLSVAAPGRAEPKNWPWILERIGSLRALKNRVFRDALTEQCLSLFQ